MYILSYSSLNLLFVLSELCEGFASVSHFSINIVGNMRTFSLSLWVESKTASFVLKWLNRTIISLFFPSWHYPNLCMQLGALESTGSRRDLVIEAVALFSGLFLATSSESVKPKESKLLRRPRFSKSSSKWGSSLVSAACLSLSIVSLPMFSPCKICPALAWITPGNGHLCF